MYDATLRAYDAAMAAARPGVAAESIHVACAEVMREAGYDQVWKVGHGVGLAEIHEFPLLQLGNTAPIEVGMVFTIDPGAFIAQNTKRVDLKWHEAKVSWLEGIFSRGDRRLADLLETAWRGGARFDGWEEHMRADIWERALAELGDLGKRIDNLDRRMDNLDRRFQVLTDDVIQNRADFRKFDQRLADLEQAPRA